MASWIYKCNSESHPYQNASGDWRLNFFHGRGANGQVACWGLLSVVPELDQLQPGDSILAYQTDRNELVGLVKMIEFAGDEVRLQAVEEFVAGVKVRPLRQADPQIAAIPALAPGPIRTLYAISDSHAQLLVAAARNAQGTTSGA
jgi:hypothetical protein